MLPWDKSFCQTLILLQYKTSDSKQGMLPGDSSKQRAYITGDWLTNNTGRRYTIDRLIEEGLPFTVVEKHTIAWKQLITLSVQITHIVQ
jgi:hypothetical protein